MQVTDLTVEVRDKNLVRKGMIPPGELNLVGSPVFNNVGVWSLSLPPEHEMAAELRKPGSGLIVWGPNDVLFSGFTETITYVASADEPYGMLQFDGVTDDTVLGEIICWPDAQHGFNRGGGWTSDHDQQSGPAESLLHGFVRTNLTSDAARASDRFVAPLYKSGAFDHGPDGARGATITKSARFEVLGPWLSDIALPYNLGFRMIQRGSKILFETYQIADRTKTVRFDLDNNQVSEQKIAVSAPDVTMTIVAGQGDMLKRAMVIGDTPTSIAAEAQWNRHKELFLDQRQSADVADLVQASTEALAAGGFTQIAATFAAVEDSTMRLGVDWNLGDRVTIVGDDDEYTAPVTSYVLKADSTGVRIGAVLGDASLVLPNRQTSKQFASLNKQLSALQTAQ